MLELVLCFHRLVIVVLSVLLPMRADRLLGQSKGIV